MQLHQFFCSLLSAVVLSTTAFAAPTAAETKKAESTWGALLASLDSKQPFDSNAYGGVYILFAGVLTDSLSGVSITHALSEGKARPVVVHIRIPRYGAAKGRFVLLPVVCRVTLREEEIRGIAEYPADSISVRVLGKITHLDAAAGIVEVQSESTSVAAAN